MVNMHCLMLLFTSYSISSSLPHALNIGFYLITKTSKGTIFFIFKIGKYNFRSSFFLPRAQKKKKGEVGCGETERENTGLFGQKGCGLYTNLCCLLFFLERSLPRA